MADEGVAYGLETGSSMPSGLAESALLRRSIRFDIGVIRSRSRRAMSLAGRTPAAVLLAIDRGAEDDRVLLTRRHCGLRDHPGETCLPGGKRHAGDADLVATALREAHEETGLRLDDIEYIACLDDVSVGGRFVTTPVVALVGSPARLHLNADEVDEAFWVAVRDLRAPGVVVARRDREGRLRYAFSLGNAAIVGATARILHQALNPEPWRPDEEGSDETPGPLAERQP